MIVSQSDKRYSELTEVDVIKNGGRTAKCTTPLCSLYSVGIERYQYRHFQGMQM